jgi:hypothetical protein
MPELYGNKFKWELRREIGELRAEAWNARKEQFLTENALRYARCEIEELKAKIRRMEQKAQGLLREATEDTEAATKERFAQTIRRRRIA